jgi:hypothetical protein
LSALGHPVIYILPDAIRLFIVFLIDASGKQADFVVGILEPRLILVVAGGVFAFGKT